MTAGRTYDISCVVWGSNPPARVEWYRGDRKDMKPIKVRKREASSQVVHETSPHAHLQTNFPILSSPLARSKHEFITAVKPPNVHTFYSF